MDEEKAEFLKEFGQDYGYPDAPKPIDEIRATEFKRLEELVYLDHAGATLYSDLQMEAVFKELTSTVLGNPHSQSDASMATSEIIREARQQVLDYFNASPGEYSCIFTSGATAALKLVGEAFPWSSRSCFMYTMENHNSVLGIREYALDQGAAAYAVDIEESMQYGETSVKVSWHSRQRRHESYDDKAAGDAYNLFALPSECNFSGVRFNLDLVKKIKEDSQNILGGSDFRRRKWLVLIDAAKGCATEKVDLSKYPADFVVMSFYKLFGYPTGLGALIVRKESTRLLRKKYFSGGTVAASIADLDFVKRREDVEASFEDGTTSFLSIASIRHGFKVLNSLTVPAISRHTASLAMYSRKMLLELKHENGTKLCAIYGGQTSEDMGPTITFNLKRADGSWFGYREVEKLASLSGIQLRTGCFCNPGACAKYLGLSHLDLLSNLDAGHVCWDDNDILNGKPTGAVRVSFGYMSTYEDAKKFIDFLKKSFITSGNHWTPLCPQRLSAGRGIRIRSIHIYPIKSCRGFSVESWPLSSTGFLYDRAWVLKSLTGEILTLKKVPSLGLISTFIDLRRGKLVIETPRCKDKLEINIDPDSQELAKEKIDVHARRYDVQTYNEDINMWFSDAVSRPCSLLRSAISRNSVSSKENRCKENNAKENGSNAGCRDVKCQLNFANEAQFLLISEESLSDLNTRLKSAHEERGAQQSSTQITPNRFRPNLVISGGAAFEEDSWGSLRIGGNLFTSMGGCNRCQMINMKSEGDEVIKSKEPLATLALYRRQKGKILFGILLRYEAVAKDEEDGDYKSIKVGDELHPDTESTPELPKVESGEGGNECPIPVNKLNQSR